MKGKYIRTGFRAASTGDVPLRVFLEYADAQMASDTQPKMSSIVLEWIKESAAVGFGGEILPSSTVGWTVKKNEISGDFPNYEPVTFPWVELYLRLRSELRRAEWPAAMVFEYPACFT